MRLAVPTLNRKWLIPLSLIILLGVAGIVSLTRDNPTQHFASKVERGDIRDVVEATGTVNAVITVQVGSQVSGTIAALNADFNSRVHKGDVVALIEPSLFKAALLQATADLESAKGNLVAVEASLVKARATYEQAKAEYGRTAALAHDNLVTQQELDLAKSTSDGAAASVDVAAATVVQAKALISQKAAAESIARTNLDHTVIRSPIDGIVVARNVDIGQTVAASLQAPTIFTIAQDLTKMRVYAKTDESDVGSIKVGQPVTFKVDAFPKETFRGVLTQIRMNPTTVQNVVTYDAIVDFANVGMRLFPGMTAYVTTPVATVTNALKLPNAALRYKPPLGPEEVRALYRKYGIEAAGEQSGRGTDSGKGLATGSVNAPGANNAPHQPGVDSVIVWKLHADNTIEPIKVTLGITDHAFTEVVAILKGSLTEGDQVVTRSVVAKPKTPGAPSVRR